jgi:hypothetical protein
MINLYGYFNDVAVERLKEKKGSFSAREDMALAAVVSVQLLHYHYIENFNRHDFRLAAKKNQVDLNKN